MQISVIRRSTARAAYTSIGTELSGDWSVWRWASSGRSESAARSAAPGGCCTVSAAAARFGEPPAPSPVIERPDRSVDDAELSAHPAERLERPIQVFVGERRGDDGAQSGLVQGDGRKHDRGGEHTLLEQPVR